VHSKQEKEFRTARVRRRSFRVAGLVLTLNVIFAIVVGLLTTTFNPEVCETTTLMEEGTAESASESSSELEARTCRPSFDAASSILIGLLTLVVVTLFEVAFDAKTALALRRKEAEFWELDDEFMRHVHNILSYTRAIANTSYGPDDRYVRHFRDELVNLEDRTREAAQTQDLVVENDQFQLAEDIDGAFREGAQRIFRHTWPVEAAGTVFTTAGWKYFFDLLVRMTSSNRLEVQTILILENIDLLRSENLLRLLQFYSSTSRMSAKIVVREDFTQIAAQNRIPSNQVDFGIYDRSLLYVTEGTQGRFTKNEYRIETYLRLFTTMWHSGGVTVPMDGKIPDGDISIQQLFNLDTEPDTPSV
jgi:hypothetical protein